MTKAPKRDLYQEVTDSIVSALETAGEWRRPWTLTTGGASAPRSIDGRSYRGVNTLLLWAAAFDAGYTSGTWGTYRAWQEHDAQVRKGEKGTIVTLWKPARHKAGDGEAAKAGEDGKVPYLLLRHFSVFNAAQVDGYEPPVVEPVPEPVRDAAADEFFAAVGADVRYGGNEAYYSPANDHIVVPEQVQFPDGEHFYTVLAHEHGHWTGHESRLGRDLRNRFGDAAYAAEELVAELTAAFVAATLGYHAVVRDDHASYVKHWIKALRDDPKAIFTAASQAQKAADFLTAAASEASEAVAA